MKLITRLSEFKSRYTLGSGLLGGTALLFISMTIVNAGNYLFNLVLGRWLGPAAFADLSLIVTLMLMVTLITATLQTIAAKFSAMYSAENNEQALANLRQWLGKWAWALGLFLGAFLLFGAPFWQDFFHSASFWPFVILALGIPVYFAQGVDRGILQGQTQFSRLALSYQAEMWVRLVIGIGFVLLGWSVSGAVGGISLSFVATWLVARQVSKHLPQWLHFTKTTQKQIIFYAGPVTAALTGQILINNSDIIIVKRFFEPEMAGLYAALALIGRIVFFATWSVVTTLFPIVAQKHQKGEAHRHLLWASLALVGLVSLVIIMGAYFFPDFVVQSLFGPAYLSVAPLLWLYAIATSIYALANVYIHYWLSLGKSTGSYLAVGGGLVQVLALWFFHPSLLQVVLVQIYIMTALLISLIIWDLWTHIQQSKTSPQNLTPAQLETPIISKAKL